MKDKNSNTSDFESVPIQLCNEDDMLKLLEIRNLDLIRSQMFNNSIIDRATHFAWWNRKSLADKLIEQVFIVKRKGIAIGMFRFWYEESFKAGNWGMFRDLRINNPLSGIYMEYKALDTFFTSQINKSNEIISQVKKGNIIEKLHKKIGFINESEDKDWIILRNNLSRFNKNKQRFIRLLNRDNII